MLALAFNPSTGSPEFKEAWSTELVRGQATKLQGKPCSLTMCTQMLQPNILAQNLHESIPQHPCEKQVSMLGKLVNLPEPEKKKDKGKNY